MQIVRLVSPHGVELWSLQTEEGVAGDVLELDSPADRRLRALAVEAGVSPADATAGRLVVAAV